MIRPTHTIATLMLLTGAAWGQQTHAPADFQPKRYDNHKLVRVDLETLDHVKIMRSLDARQLSCHGNIGPTSYVVAPEILDEMAARGIDFEVLDHDIQASIEAERRRIEFATANAAAGIGSWYDDYKDQDTIEQKLLELQAARPDLVTLHDIGDSIEGRDIWAMTITGPGDGDKPAALFTGTQHAREWLSPMMNVFLAEHLISNYDANPRVRAIVDGIEILIVPIANPDGYEHSWLPPEQGGDRFWRKNRRHIEGDIYGVDMNRNWDSHWGQDDIGSSGETYFDTYRGSAPFSEPEVAALRDFIVAHPNVKTHIDYHIHGQLILTPYGYTEEFPADHELIMALGTMMEADIEAVHGYDYLVGPVNTVIYPVNGLINDWCYDERDVLSYTIELRPDKDCYACFETPADLIIPTCEENLPAAMSLMESIVAPVTWVFPGRLAHQVESGSSTTVPVQIVAAPGAIVSGTERLFSRQSISEPFTETPLTSLGGLDYAATLPAIGSSASLQFYLAVDTSDGQTIMSPTDAPTELHHAGAVDLVRAWSFDEDPNWTTEGDWAFGQPTGNGGFVNPDVPSHPDPTGGHTGVNVYGNNLDGDAVQGTVGLTSEAIDCTGLRNVQLRFWRWLNLAPEGDWASAEVSHDGVTWRGLFGGAVAENTWTEHVFDISEIADGKPTVYVRWTLDAVQPYTGWNLDDVEIWATPKPVACRGDLNLDGDVGFDDLTKLLLAWGTWSNCEEDIDGDGVVGFTDLTELLTNWGPCE